MSVNQRRTPTNAAKDLALWTAIRKSAEAMSFSRKYYQGCMDIIMGSDGGDQVMPSGKRKYRWPPPYTEGDAYRLLKVATETFVMANCGVALADPKPGEADFTILEKRAGLRLLIDSAKLRASYRKGAPGYGKGVSTLPYLALLREKLRAIGWDGPASAIDVDEGTRAACEGILLSKLANPWLSELIWSYWHEEGMLVQTMNAISRRFQDGSPPRGDDPLASLELDPLRPLNNLLWGYIRDEPHRLTAVRRAHEYDHHYGLTLHGKAASQLRPANSRSKFFVAFHNLLTLCAVFFKQSDDTAVAPDGFPLLNALKEVHLLLSQGAHNQFGDLPSTARIEMLMQQWLLARPEFREFLAARTAVAYPEPWMDRVDAMKRLQGWTDVSVQHFHDLAVFGEQILLGIRFGAWAVEEQPTAAARWARFWRREIQGYSHAYRAATGMDLATARS